MSSTHVSLHYHLVFSTKNRTPSILHDWRDRLHAYLGGIVQELNGVAEAVGGTNDHVHLLVRLRTTHTLADVVRDIKAFSSGWVHDEIGASKFKWQDGYGAFTVAASNCGKVSRYIARQQEHHRVRTFKEEYVGMLKRAGIEFDEEYLW